MPLSKEEENRISNNYQFQFKIILRYVVKIVAIIHSRDVKPRTYGHTCARQLSIKFKGKMCKFINSKYTFCIFEKQILFWCIGSRSERFYLIARRRRLTWCSLRAWFRFRPAGYSSFGLQVQSFYQPISIWYLIHPISYFIPSKLWVIY